MSVDDKLLLNMSNERLANIIISEMARCVAADVDWRNTFFSRNVVEVPNELRPAPDGSSLEYLEVAYRLGVQARAQADARDPKSPMLSILNELVQSEISQSRFLEHTLIRRISS